MSPDNDIDDMRRVFSAQRAAARADRLVTSAVRVDRLRRAVELLVDNEAALCAALNEDFGHRSVTASRMSDIVPPIRALKHAITNIERWLADEPRAIGEAYVKAGANGIVRYQPKGVVGNILPWNAPLNVGFSSLAGMFAAGNRIIIKPSEFAPATALKMQELVSRYFDPTELAVVTGGVDLGRAFAALPFDHILYTGSPAVGRHILAAAAANLTPVTLELGGKCPVIIGRSADVELATDRVVMGKMINAGQVCLAPDYVLAPRDREAEIVAGLLRNAELTYPRSEDNDDYTAIINEPHRHRIDSLLIDAREKGADIVLAHGDSETENHLKRRLTIVRNASPNMRVMQEELFGPILPILTYGHIEEAIQHVNENANPLALYYFGSDPSEEDQVLRATLSGGVTINDVIAHVSHEELPFGGVGNSGTGAYHGFDGFKTFSHARSIYRQSNLDLAGMSGGRAPFGAKIEATLAAAIRK